MKAITIIILPIVLGLITVSCANEKALRGGQKDETKPTLIESTPENGDTQVNTEEIVLTFDEWVKIEQLGSQLIVTPRLSETPDYTIRKNVVTLSFKEPLEDSTTYVFNFREAIKDVNENNPADFLKLSFSTGQFIDSLFVEGTAIDPYNNEPLAEAVVGLYPLSDTADLFKIQPYYFGITDGSGSFRLENIRAGKYKIWVWEDENSNLKADSRSEAYGFILDTLNLNGDTLAPIEFTIQKINTQAFKLNNARPTGKYYRVNYNKPIVEFTVAPLLGNGVVPPYNRVNDRKSLQFYKYGIDYNDSTAVIITAKDTLYQEAIDTVWLTFNESQRRPDEYKVTAAPKTNSSIGPNSRITLTFSKPLLDFSLDSVTWNYDSLNMIGANLREPILNNTRTELSFRVSLPDSIRAIRINRLDSVTVDTTYEMQYLERATPLTFPKGTFISVDSDTLESTKFSYSREDTTSLAILAGKINLEGNPRVKIQLLQSGTIKAEQWAQSTYRFIRLTPGEYNMRILVDENGDGYWKPGNILSSTLMEPVFFYPQLITLRANWEVTDANIEAPTTNDKIPQEPEPVIEEN